MPAAPKWNDQVRFDQETEMFGNALAGHAKMAAKLIQSLAILEMKLIEESTSTRVGQSFKDIVHARQPYATKWLHI